ncbi:MAG: hypothetical protein K0V04_02715 [Deltaproteobacteria bacterium]|nr:hypothetical protein [Deltaproteobacteria bacterium]
MNPYPVVPCAAPSTPAVVSPTLDVPKPRCVMMRKVATRPASAGGGVETYLAESTLDVVLSTNPPGAFGGRAALTGANIDKLAVSPNLIRAGILTPLSATQGPGWVVAAGVLRTPFTVRLHPVAPSVNFEDIKLTLTLEAKGTPPVGPPVTTSMTCVELTIDVDDKPARVGAAAPVLLDAYAKNDTCALVMCERPAAPQPRTKLTLRRAIPHDLPWKLTVAVSPDDHGQQHVELATLAQAGVGDMCGPALEIANTSIDAAHGAHLYLRGLAAHPRGSMAAVIEVYTKKGPLLGDACGVFVDPLVEARWGHAWIYPEHDATLDAGSAQHGDDRAVQLSEVELVIDTVGLPGTSVPTVTVHRCDATETQIAVPALANLQLNANGEVVTNAGHRPVFSVAGRRGSWRPPLSPFYFFKVAVANYTAASVQTENDPTANEAACLRAKYFHSFVGDPSAHDILSTNTRDAVLMRVYGATHDRAAVAGPALTNHRFAKPDLGGLPNGFADWVNAAKNTYGYFHFSHGGYGGTQPVAHTPVPANFYCGLHFGGQSFTFTDIVTHLQSVGASHHDFPRHVMMLASCHSGWDPRIAQRLIPNRADCYVIAFRQTILPTQVRAFAGNFFGEWLVDHRGDPNQVTTAFARAAHPLGAMEPVLFHRNSNFAILPL